MMSEVNTSQPAFDNHVYLMALATYKTSNPVIITDKYMKIEWVNDGFTKLTGYKLEEVIGKRPKNILVGPNTNPKTVDNIQTQLHNCKPCKEEIQYYTKGGKTFWVELLIEPVFDEFGTLSRFINVAKDITDHKKYEAELIEARNKAEEALKAKSKFLSLISHEFKTPLNAILGMTNLLIEEAECKEHLDRLNTLKFSSEYLLKLIDDILTFSRTYKLGPLLNEQEFSMHELVNGVSSMLNTNFEEGEVKYKVNVDPEIPDALMGDANLLGQVLINLLNNAVKFTHKGFIGLSVNKIDEGVDEASIRFEVSDSGIGIPEDRLDKIFEAFEQGDETIALNYGGKGLGLAIVKRLVHLMSGRIEVKSTVGEGSQFFFTITFKKPKAAKMNTPCEDNNNKSLRGKNILVVDDNPINQKVVTKFLERWGVKYQTVNNGLEAIELLGKVHFDCIIMDIQMPVMNGVEATLKIRSSTEARVSETPIIAMSASSNPEEDMTIQNTGFNAFLNKPFQPFELQKLIVEVMKDDRNGAKCKYPK